MLSSVNAAIRFMLEISALIALGYWGSQLGDSTTTRAAMAILAPLVAAVAWGLWVAPKAGHRVADPARVVIEVAVFGGAAIGLALAGRRNLGLILAAVALANIAFMFLFDQR